MKSMKAIVKSRPEAGLWMEDVPVPQPGPNDVLVRIHKTAICGTDLHIFNWDEWSRKHVTTPVVIGHEFAGTVEAVGDGVRGFKKGDVVSGEGHIVCGVCRNCMAGRRHLCRDTAGVGVSRAGAFAEFLCIPAANVWYAGDSASSGRKQRATEVTENGDGPERPNLCSPSSVTSVAGLSAVPMDVLAYFDPLGNATHAALSFDLVGEDVLITGAGPIGIMAAAVAKHVGARYVVVTDVNPYRLVLARRIGADLALDVRTQKIEDAQDALNMREGFDVGLEMSGSPEAFRSMLSNMRHGAGISLLGILPPDTSINWDRVIFNSLILKGIYGREMFETWYKMTSMIQSGLDVSTVLTHRFPAERFREAFEVVRSGDCGKVILEWA